MAVPEARLRTTRFGLAADGEGWFVLNAGESRWRDFGPLGAGCDFEGRRPFRQLGINLNVLGPGEPLGMYHRENHQEGFLVVAGECVLIVEGEERALRPWDFFHCPGGTAHVIVGAGAGPSIVVAVGARGGRKGLVYLREPAALARGAGVAQETTRPAEAYRLFPRPCAAPAGRAGCRRSPEPRAGHARTALRPSSAEWIHTRWWTPCGRRSSGGTPTRWRPFCTRTWSFTSTASRA